MTRDLLLQDRSTAAQLRATAARYQVACNQCGSLEKHPYCPENGLGLVQCAQCGLVFVGQRPQADHLYTLYGADYFKNDNSGVVGYTDYLKDEPNIRKTFARRLRHVERFVKPGQLLDIGCAAGFFMDEAHARGWAVQGMDVSDFAVEYARQRFGYDVRCGSLLDQDYQPESYDLITMWDVIEHVPDPKAYIQHSARLAKRGGILALATPDIDSIPARFTGKRWVGYKLSEEHIYYFSRRTLSNMLAEAGFEIIHVRHVGKYVTLRLFLDRLSMYSPLAANGLELIERAFHLSERSLYINPFDIIAITARKA